MKTTIGIAVAFVIVVIAAVSFVDSRKEPAVSSNEPAPTVSNSELPKRISVTGTSECLPHTNTTGPQTMECAFGIAVDQSDAHYALDLQLLQSDLGAFQTGQHMKVEGLLTPANQLNSNMWQKYPIDGIISVASVTKL